MTNSSINISRDRQQLNETLNGTWYIQHKADMTNVEQSSTACSVQISNQSSTLTRRQRGRSRRAYRK